MDGLPENSNNSYFRQCKGCGQAIHMRQMPAGQWVAFDDATRVHDCQNQSAYNDIYLEATRTLAIPLEPATPPAAGEPLPTTARLAIPPTPITKVDSPVMPPARPRASPMLWVIGLALLLLGGGWLASSTISLRPVGSALAQGTPVAPANALADEPALASPARSDEATPTSAPNPSQLGIQTLIELQSFDFIYVRAGPDLAYPEIARVYAPSTPFAALGRNATREWVFGELADGTPGWVKREFLLSAEPLEELPLQEADHAAGIQARVVLQGFDFIYVQQGPGVEFDEAGRLDQPNAPFEALARSIDGEWLFVQLQNGTVGWVKREFVVSDSSLELLPSYESKEIKP